LEEGALKSPMYSLKGPKMLDGDFAPNFPLKHQQKDVRLAIALGDQVGQPLPVAAAANETLKAARAAGYGDDERTRLIEQEHRDKMEMMGNQIDYSTSLITEREDAIKEIESTMLEVNEIYKDLSTLVVEQGAALDNIEANMSVADSNVESGAGQLSQASRYQKKARNKACICLLGVSIVLAILVVVLVTSLKK